MSNELYLILQSVIIICYASWVAYRVGKSKGKEEQARYNHIIFKSWKDTK